jgi:hypothetical protein
MLVLNGDDEQELVRRSFSKIEIEEAVRAFIERHLEHTDSGTLYLFVKQIEYAVKIALEALKEGAFDSIGRQLDGLISGKVGGHTVVISYPYEWQYSPAVDELKEQQKQDLSELQDREKVEGVAKQVPGKGRIVVTLREE